MATYQPADADAEALRRMAAIADDIAASGEPLETWLADFTELVGFFIQNPAF